MLVYKVFRTNEWSELANLGATAGAPVDRADGFIHFSTALQLPETLRRHFARETGLILAAADATVAGDALRWEAARDGDLFPHLYRALTIDDIVWSRPIEDGPEGHLCPEGLE
jgi:uncharacterized protein (DUF952 family)